MKNITHKLFFVALILFGTTIYAQEATEETWEDLEELEEIVLVGGGVVDLAEDRGRFQEFVNEHKLKQPPNGIASSVEDAMKISEDVGFPLVVRPSYVLGGRAMEVVYKKTDLENYLIEAVQASSRSPVLLDGFLNQATEMDIEAVCDGKEFQTHLLH